MLQNTSFARRSRSCYTPRTWATHMRSLLFEHGFGYVWISNTIGDANQFIHIFTKRIKDTSILFLNSVLRPFQDYFSSYETGQSVGGAKTGEPREKPPDTSASRTWLVSHTSIQNWRSRLDNSSKAEHYKHFKALLGIEKYLFTDLSYIARQKR